MNECESCGKPTKGRLCIECVDEALEALQERYYVRCACTYTEYRAELARIKSMWKA